MRLLLASLVASVTARSLVLRDDISSDSITLAADGSGLDITINATCGGTLTCIGSTFGDCCSSHNFCGSTPDYCGAGCIPEFGTCSSASATPTDPVPTASPSSSSSAAAAAVPASTSTTAADGISRGSISPATSAGIAVGVTAGVVALGVAGWLWSRRYQSKKRQQEQRQKQMALDEYSKGVGGGYINDVTGEHYGSGSSSSESSYVMLARPPTQYTFHHRQQMDDASFSANYSAFQQPYTPARSLASASPSGAGRLARSPMTMKSEPPLPPMAEVGMGSKATRKSIYEVEGDGKQYTAGDSPAVDPVELDSHEKETQAFRFI